VGLLDRDGRLVIIPRYDAGQYTIPDEYFEILNRAIDIMTQSETGRKIYLQTHIQHNSKGENQNVYIWNTDNNNDAYGYAKPEFDMNYEVDYIYIRIDIEEHDSFEKLVGTVIEEIIHAWQFLTSPDPYKLDQEHHRECDSNSPYY
jgi:hypothetical protein